MPPISSGLRSATLTRSRDRSASDSGAGKCRCRRDFSGTDPSGRFWSTGCRGPGDGSAPPRRRSRPPRGSGGTTSRHSTPLWTVRPGGTPRRSGASIPSSAESPVGSGVSSAGGTSTITSANSASDGRGASSRCAVGPRRRGCDLPRQAPSSGTRHVRCRSVRRSRPHGDRTRREAAEVNLSRHAHAFAAALGTAAPGTGQDTASYRWYVGGTGERRAYGP